MTAGNQYLWHEISQPVSMWSKGGRCEDLAWLPTDRLSRVPQLEMEQWLTAECARYLILSSGHNVAFVSEERQTCSAVFNRPQLEMPVIIVWRKASMRKLFWQGLGHSKRGGPYKTIQTLPNFLSFSNPRSTEHICRLYCDHKTLSASSIIIAWYETSCIWSRVSTPENNTITSLRPWLTRFYFL